ncbi:hypothetical protein MASR2M36_06390 [Providencia sp.]
MGTLSTLITLIIGVMSIIQLARKGIYYLDNKELIVALDMVNKSGSILNEDNKLYFYKIINSTVPRLLTGLPSGIKRELILKLLIEDMDFLFIRQLKNKRIKLHANGNKVRACYSDGDLIKRKISRFFSILSFLCMAWLCFELLTAGVSNSYPNIKQMVMIFIFEGIGLFLWNNYPSDNHLRKINAELDKYVLSERSDKNVFKGTGVSETNN